MDRYEKIKNDPRIMKPLAELLQKIQEMLGPSHGKPSTPPQDFYSSEPQQPQ